MASAAAAVAKAFVSYKRNVEPDHTLTGRVFYALRRHNHRVFIDRTMKVGRRTATPREGRPLDSAPLPSPGGSLDVECPLCPAEHRRDSAPSHRAAGGHVHHQGLAAPSEPSADPDSAGRLLSSAHDKKSQ
jgi:hypothetical protein